MGEIEEIKSLLKSYNAAEGPSSLGTLELFSDGSGSFCGEDIPMNEDLLSFCRRVTAQKEQGTRHGPPFDKHFWRHPTGKCWKIVQNGLITTTYFGRPDKHTTISKQHPYSYLAAEYATTKIREKERKGYVRVV